MLNPTQFGVLCNLFPDLTPAQAESVVLYSMGASQAEIIEIRHVSSASVKRSLHEARIKLDLPNLNSLRTAVLIRMMSNIITSISAKT